MSDITIDISEARSQISRIDERLKREHVIRVTRHKKDAFAFVDVEYLEALQETVEVLSDPESMKLLAASIEDIRHGRVHDHEDVKRELLQ